MSGNRNPDELQPIEYELYFVYRDGYGPSASTFEKFLLRGKTLGYWGQILAMDHGRQRNFLIKKFLLGLHQAIYLKVNKSLIYESQCWDQDQVEQVYRNMRIELVEVSLQSGTIRRSELETVAKFAKDNGWLTKEEEEAQPTAPKPLPKSRRKRRKSKLRGALLLALVLLMVAVAAIVIMMKAGGSADGSPEALSQEENSGRSELTDIFGRGNAPKLEALAGSGLVLKPGIHVRLRTGDQEAELVTRNGFLVIEGATILAGQKVVGLPVLVYGQGIALQFTAATTVQILPTSGPVELWHTGDRVVPFTVTMNPDSFTLAYTSKEGQPRTEQGLPYSDGIGFGPDTSRYIKTSAGPNGALQLEFPVPAQAPAP